VHVPFMIKGRHPALKAGTVRNELVNALDIPATTLAFGGAKMPDYLDGQNLFGDDYKAVDHVVSARDRCDYTIDRIRTVRTEQFRYLRNYFADRPMLQAQYRDNRPEVLEMHAAHKSGTLTAYQDTHWFGDRPKEELYELGKDPYQINNLADDPKFAAELKKHRDILDVWIKRTGDKGELPEAAVLLKPTYDLWKDLPIFKNAKVNPEYDQFRR
ncbi:MAG: arylsulfatase A-like enzyme, partial [Verrucomicrobiales bacterium]